MSFNDIFKGDFFNNITAIAPIDMAVALGLAVIIGIFIMEVYKKTFSGVMYSKSFGTSLLAMTIITTFIICIIVQISFCLLVLHRPIFEKIRERTQKPLFYPNQSV